MSGQTFTQRRALRAYRDAQREAIHKAERAAHLRTPQPPEPCNFCAAPEPEAREPFDWLDAALFVCCGVLLAVFVVAVIVWWLP